jgi:hypothetical protein
MSIYTNLILGVFGIWVLITGIKAIKAKVNVAIIEILPERDDSWKNISRVIKPKIHRGTKICIKLAPGSL